MTDQAKPNQTNPTLCETIKAELKCSEWIQASTESFSTVMLIQTENKNEIKPQVKSRSAED